jgi:hypothetical protein
MTAGPSVDGLLVQWGERLFYPASRIVKSPPLPRLDTMVRRKAGVIRKRIEAITVRGAPQVMVRVTGGGRGMGAIATHFRYISKEGRLPIEDDREVTRSGKETLRDLVDQWRYGGSLIDEVSHRREAFNIMLSMPAGTDTDLLKKAVREFAKAELGGHRYVMVLHEHQANPHVHLSVRAESLTGKRLNPRMADLHRWRETFAEKLRGWGIDAEATRQATRGVTRNYEPLWRRRARAEGGLRHAGVPFKAGPKQAASRSMAALSWAHVLKILATSESVEDRQLAEHVARYVKDLPTVRERSEQRQKDLPLETQQPPRQPRHERPTDRSGPDISR